MASYLIAVCRKCGWWTKPLVDDPDARPICVNCVRKMNPDGKFSLANVKNPPHCRIIEVAPVKRPFGQRRSKPFTAPIGKA